MKQGKPRINPFPTTGGLSTPAYTVLIAAVALIVAAITIPMSVWLIALAVRAAQAWGWL